MSYMISYCRP